MFSSWQKRSSTLALVGAVAISLLVVGGAVEIRAQQTTDWKPIEQAMGKAGKAQPGGVLRFGFPRTDLAGYR